MYILYSDKNNVFECDIQLEGASLSDSFARVIVEGDNLNLVFNGVIDNNGSCRIEMPKLNMLKEGGEMKLEVIADDMYFNPWNSNFELNKTKVNVKVNNHKPQVTKVKEPKKTIKESKFTKQDLKTLLLKLRSQD
jgi:hypothetical protein